MPTDVLAHQHMLGPIPCRYEASPTAGNPRRTPIKAVVPARATQNAADINLTIACQVATACHLIQCDGGHLRLIKVNTARCCVTAHCGFEGSCPQGWHFCTCETGAPLAL